MSGTALFVFFSVVILIAILLLFSIKAGLQLQYLRIKKGKKPGEVIDFVRFDISDPKERKLRWDAFLLFPMLYAVILDDEKESLNNIKRKIKRIHIGIYFTLIALVILGVYSEKVFPAS